MKEKKKTIKKVIVAGLFAIAFLITGVWIGGFETDKILAADATDTTDTTEEAYFELFDNFSDYRTSGKYSVPKATADNYKEWIFAGWYESDKTTTVSEGTTSGQYYAKFLPAEVLSVKCQVLDGTTEGQTGKSKMRVITTVDSLQYESVGFDFYIEEIGYKNYTAKKVAKKIVAKDDAVNFNYSPNIFDLHSKYFTTVTVTGIKPEWFDNGFFIKPYWVTEDGTKVYGVSRFARVEDYYKEIINVSVRVYSDSKIETANVTVDYDQSKFTYYGTGANGMTVPSEWADDVFTTINITNDASTGVVTCSGNSAESVKLEGSLAHLRLQKKQGVTLTKKNEFVVSSDLSYTIPNVVYKHFAPSFTATASNADGDQTWYNTTDTKFVITTADELIGFSKLSNDDNFTDKTVYLGCDITLYTGNASSWNNSARPSGDDTVLWDPIGGKDSNNRFAGIFDGQGHTISGVFASAANNVGLFHRPTENAYIKNFRLTNSSFSGLSTASNPGAVFVGSILASGAGTIEGVYSDAYIRVKGDYAGGMVGAINVNDETMNIQNCWYNGTITNVTATQKGENTGGIVGGVGYTNTSAKLFVKNCLYTGTLDMQNKLQNNAGELIGIVHNSSTVEMSDVLMDGKVVKSNGTIGEIIGKINSNDLVSIKDGGVVYYVSSEQSEIPIGDKTAIVVSSTDIQGETALTTLLGLNFGTDWVAGEQYPIPACFATPTTK